MFIDRLVPQDQAHCRNSLKGGSRTFFAASLLLPRRFAESATALYAFCRAADDLVDGGGDLAAAIAEVRLRMDGIYGGKVAKFAEDRAFAACVRAHAIPKAVLELMLEGFIWDAQRRHYETFPQLRAYAVRVAGTVGVMMAMLMGVRDRERLSRACELGVAMQLTNIARDVGEDARAGRLYLPLEWLRAEGIAYNEWLEAPKFDPALARVVGRLLRAAEPMYARSEAGIAALPRACRPAIYTARLLYAEIGHAVARAGYNSMDQRAVVSSVRKMLTLAAAPFTRRADASDAPPDLVPEAGGLLDAACAGGPGTQGSEAWARARPVSRAVWVVELFERLARMERDANPVSLRSESVSSA